MVHLSLLLINLADLIADVKSFYSPEMSVLSVKILMAGVVKLLLLTLLTLTEIWYLVS